MPFTWNILMSISGTVNKVEFEILNLKSNLNLKSVNVRLHQKVAHAAAF